MENIWKIVKETIRSKVPEGRYRVWISPLTYGGLDGDTLIINCPNQFFASWIQEHYLSILRKELTQEGYDWNIRLSPAEIARHAARDQLHLPNFAPNELPRPKFCKRFTFQEFVVGDCNRYPFSACWSAANEEDCHGKIIYLHSKAGLGKSHLTQAVGQTIIERKPDKRVCYLTTNDFTSHVVRAIKDGAMEKFKRHYQRECDVLLLEEVQSFAGRERTQSELALVLDPLLEKGKTIIFTSNKLPREIPKLNDQLRSRLTSGLITTINPPDLSTREKILIRKAKNQGITLKEEVLDFLAHNLEGDIRQIESAVVGLAAKSSFLRRSVDMDLAREVLKDLVGEAVEITVEAIRDTICHHFHLTKEEICSRSRKRSITWPRQLAMYLARKQTDVSLEAIGREFNRDHATVIHSIERVRKQLNESGKVRHQVEFLINCLKRRQWQS